MANAFGIDDDRISKALNPSQVHRLYAAQARLGRSPGENAIIGSERSHRDLMDAAGRGRVPKAARKRGYDDFKLSDAVDRSTLKKYPRDPKKSGLAGIGKGFKPLDAVKAAKNTGKFTHKAYKGPTTDLAARMAAGKAAGKRPPRNSLSQTALMRMKEDPLS